MVTDFFLRWFDPARRNQARLSAAQRALAAAALNLDDAADLLDDIRRDAEVKAAFNSVEHDRESDSHKKDYGRETRELRIAAAEVRGIALPDF